MMQVAILQTDIFWEDPQANYDHLYRKLKNISEVDLIVLPEMFTTGFSMNAPSIAEEHEGNTLKWMIGMAKEKQSTITGSIVIQEKEKYFNRLYWVNKNGQYHSYDKRHLFRMAKEDQYYQYGDKRLIVLQDNFRFCPMICYDLRFPVWSRNINQHQQPAYDCLIYVANWPEARTDSWTSLLKARAIENQAFVIGVNRVGTDYNNTSYSGESRVFDPKGVRLDRFKENTESVEIISLDKKILDDFREAFPTTLDADRFNII